MSRLILGCASFGNVYSKLNYLTCYQLVKKAIANNIYHFDTSPYYGNSQDILGKIIKQLNIEGINTNSLIISTKVGRYGDNDFDFSESKCLESVNQSLKLLNRQYLDIVFCHDIEFSNNLNEIIETTLPTLDKLKKKGKIKKIGISGLPLSVLDYIVKQSQVKIDVILTYCSYTLHYSDLDLYIDDWKSKGCEIIHGGVTAMGLLTKQGPPEWHPADHKTKNICLILNQHYPDLTQLAFYYTYSNLKINQIMIGPSNLKELQEYLTWIHHPNYFNKEIENIKNYFLTNNINYIWKENNSIHNIEIAEKKIVSN